MTTSENQPENPPTSPLTHTNPRANPPCANCPHRATSHINTDDDPPRKPTTCQMDKCECRQYEPMRLPPKYAITFHTDEYRGDHAADVTIAYEHIPGESIEGLMKRIAQTRKPIKKTDYLVVRILSE